jgi:hypothetical protein
MLSLANVVRMVRCRTHLVPSNALLDLTEGTVEGTQVVIAARERVQVMVLPISLVGNSASMIKAENLKDMLLQTHVLHMTLVRITLRVLVGST